MRAAPFAGHVDGVDATAVEQVELTVRAVAAIAKAKAAAVFSETLRACSRWLLGTTKRSS